MNPARSSNVMFRLQVFLLLSMNTNNYYVETTDIYYDTTTKNHFLKCLEFCAQEAK